MFERFRRYSRVSKVSPIARRYFVMNAFDGTLTMLGIIIGAYLSGYPDVRIIISAGVAASIAMCISGISGTYMTEKAERTRELKKLEEAMLIDLDRTIQAEASEFASFISALIDGLSPAVAAIVILSPFFFNLYGIIENETAFWSSLGLTALLLFGLGGYLAKISDESLIGYGTRMLIIGLVTAIICIGVARLLGGTTV